MFVNIWMSQPVITIDADDSMKAAIALLEKHDIRTLPVMKNGKLVGIVTDRDLKRESASHASSLEVHELKFLLTRIQVSRIMTKHPITIPTDFTLEETARTLLAHKISGAPVVDEKETVVGMITRDDLLRVMTHLTGVDKRGIQFGFQVADRPKSVFDLADIIRQYNGRMVSLLTSYEKVPPGCRNVLIRAYQLDRRKLPQLLDQLQKNATVLYMMDHRNDHRDVPQKGGRPCMP